MLYNCYKVNRGSDFDKAIKKHFSQRPLWKNVMTKLGGLLDENITQLGLITDSLWVNTDEIKKEENKKMFTTDGKLKNNTKRAKELSVQYKRILEEEGLSDFQELRVINFCYGVMRMQGQKLESFVTDEFDTYYKADFDLEQRVKGCVVPITEIEYEEKYLEELRKRNENENFN